MILFESFYAQEWVQVTTAFVYVILILTIPLIFWKISKRLTGQAKANYIELSLDIYVTILFLLIAPIGYLVLYFIGSESKFMLNDPLPWVCLVGGAGALVDFVRSHFKLNVAIVKSDDTDRVEFITQLKKLVKIASALSLVPLVYGLVMVGVTNLSDVSKLSSLVWFFTFLITGWSIIYTTIGKSILYVSQAYATDASLGGK
ncbi:hypothetical protein HYO27_22425 [Vibrio parahaemolyticus]|nr:hypothetical protein [Vibrio parahaemolyticus]